MICSPLRFDNTTAIVFIFDGESRNDAIICSASESRLTLRDTSGVKVDVSLPLLWCP